MIRGMATFSDSALLADLLARAQAVEPSRLKAATAAGLTAAFVLEWAQYIEETGDESPTLEHWAAWAYVAERTAYRRLAAFRRLTGEHDPTDRARAVISRSSSTSSSPSSTPATA